MAGESYNLLLSGEREVLIFTFQVLRSKGSFNILLIQQPKQTAKERHI